MRIIRIELETGSTTFASEHPNGVFVETFGSFERGFQETGRTLKAVRKLSPIIPPAILCVGLNYANHAKESGMAIPSHPVLFMKNPAALNHPDAKIIIPTCCVEPPQLDYEAELAIVIGRAAKDVSVSDAPAHIFGYTAANDVSARHWQRKLGGGQWCRGKSFDGFCPLGPSIVTSDELNPSNLQIQCRVNGTVRQNSRTSEMIFPVNELVSRLSAGMTLLPGTVILTGTPPGVAMATEGPYLSDGDIVEVEIEGIGILRSFISNS